MKRIEIMIDIVKEIEIDCNFEIIVKKEQEWH